MTDAIFYVRAVHFAATLLAAGATFFMAFIGEAALAKATDGGRMAVRFRIRIVWTVWIGLIAGFLSGEAWLFLTAASMSGAPMGQMFSNGVLWTVLSQTEFGNDWLARLVFGCALAAVLAPTRSGQAAPSAPLDAAAIVMAASLAGSLAWTGHAIGGQGLDGVLHPAADALHLVAAAGWLGGLVALAMLLAMSTGDEAALEITRIAVARFSALGIVYVATLLVTGIVNTWYLAASLAALTGTQYGRLLLVKIALFLGMVGIAAVNRFWLTPALLKTSGDGAAQRTARRLYRNAILETLLGGAIIAIVAVLGTLPPASHTHHHAVAEAVPPDAAFQHLHSMRGMADITIEPGRVGTARATVHLLDDDLETLPARRVIVTLTAPAAGAPPATYPAAQNPGGEWQVDAVELGEPGNWIVTIEAAHGSGEPLKLTGPIVIDAR